MVDFSPLSYKTERKPINDSPIPQELQKDNLELPCFVNYIRFRSENSGYAILDCTLDKESNKYRSELEPLVEQCADPNQFVVSTSMLNFGENPAGGQYIFVGKFVANKKYGNQFKSDFYYRDSPTTIDGLRTYLMMLPHIKDVRSNEIIKKFGVEETIEVLDKTPEKLLEINGITEDRLKLIKEAWDRDTFLRRLYIFLGEHDIAPSLGQKIFDLFKQASIEILKENPYRVIEVKGIGFKTADVIAYKINPNMPMDYRTKACIYHVLKENFVKNSNLCLPYSILKDTVLELLKTCDLDYKINTNIDEYAKLIPQCIRNENSGFVAIQNLNNKEAFIYLKHVYNHEKAIANMFFKRRHLEHSRIEKCTDDDVDVAQEDVTKFNNRNIVLDLTQRQAIMSAFNHKVTIITGPGGTGKSTICRCICSIADEKGLAIRLMSPTGKASQVLAEKTGHHAATIHRSLRMVPNESIPKESIMEDIVIVDEFSMVGIDTLYAISLALEKNMWGNIVLVGDANQLPSVSPGNFLFDLMSVNCANIIRLDKIHRQDENSYITVLANDISNGKTIHIPDNATDMRWISSADSDICNVVESDIMKYLKKNGNLSDLQLLSPKYKGDCGVDAMNSMVQNIMMEHNGTKDRFLQREFHKFYVGDRVIQLENNYDKEVFNGDIGVITDIGIKVIDPQREDKKDMVVTVNYYGDIVTYIGQEVEQITLAWCCTVHKYQGSQMKNIMFIVSREANIMFSKELVYTALTRAEKFLSIYGSMDILNTSPVRSAIKKRYTNFQNFYNELEENKSMFRSLNG